MLLFLPNLGMGGSPSDAVVVTTTAETPAGKPRRRKKYLVQIDGQDFEVANIAEAEALLIRAKSLAENAAQEVATKQVKRARRRKRAVRVDSPVIATPNPELQSLVSEYRDDIDAIYKQVARDAEIRDLLRLKMLEEDEEDAIIALIH